jgi:hypothetical protein
MVLREMIMERPENNKWLDKALTETIGSKETRTNFEQWKLQHPDAVNTLTSRVGSEAHALLDLHKTRRIIMKSPTTKLAAAAVIIALVLIGVSQFGGSATSVAWGEVIGRLEASRGLICRRIMILSNRPGEEDYRMIYSCPTHTRTDQYEANQIIWSRYCDYDARTMVRIEYDNKRYFRHTMSEQEAQEHRDEISPKVWAQKFQSGDCRELGQKMIDGILCEGLETTDQAVVGESDPPVVSPVLQLWVSVETGYPVLFEGNAVREADNDVRIEVVLDQFQWNVELDPSEFEPNIPPDYELTD